MSEITNKDKSSMDSYVEALVNLEKFKSKLYHATEGEKYLTIGYGHVDYAGDYKDKIITEKKDLNF